MRDIDRAYYMQKEVENRWAEIFQAAADAGMTRDILAAGSGLIRLGSEILVQSKRETPGKIAEYLRELARHIEERRAWLPALQMVDDDDHNG